MFVAKQTGGKGEADEDKQPTQLMHRSNCSDVLEEVTDCERDELDALLYWVHLDETVPKD
jgi:hypothetical protein